jgi:AraC-like DNA-binding protein
MAILLAGMTDMELSELARTIPEPADYHRGVSPVVAGAPTNVLVFKRDRPFGGLAHHHRHVLITCLEGPGSVIVEGQVHPVGPGQGFLVFPYQGHDYGRFAAEPVVWLFVTFEFAEQPALVPLRNVAWELDARSRELLGGVASGYRAALGGDGDAADALGFRLGELLARLARRAGDSVRRSGPVAEPSGRGAVIREAVRFVHENLARPVSAEELAARLALSPSRLRAVFREEIGAPLGEFVARARMNRACALLGRSDLSVSEVAAACGFESIYSFSRAFRRRKGMAPTEFRKQAR